MASEREHLEIVVNIHRQRLGATQTTKELEDGEGSHMDIHPTVIDFLGL